MILETEVTCNVVEQLYLNCQRILISIFNKLPHSLCYIQNKVYILYTTLNLTLTEDLFHECRTFTSGSQM